jgi:methionyl-tRNA formyltransferase
MNILVLTDSFASRFIENLRNNKAINLSTSYQFEDIKKSIDVVFTYNYDKIIPVEYFDIPKIGIFVLHSSDLPKGRGWAPIYNSIANKEEKYVISLIKISESPDCGNIFLKLNLNKPKLITNNNLRNVDEIASEVLVNHFIGLCLSGNVNRNTTGYKQDNTNATYYKKRTPEDNVVDKDKSISSAIYKILSTNENYPSFVEIDGVKVYLSAYIEKQYNLRDIDYSIETFI